ncbi:EF-hand domain-containing protein [Streptomyces sp. NBC_01754]|uniref:EF-hand domain-containing protein n=1 Tax=Streptomyces sp. NBC_01754 TaxID=2975930 RepID=UPI002DD7AC85|nr:EF-hand domain-containing protein [Streptomyces sp. NBC_01754]WSC94913.1 EF-hand domain-containing protein [Streptomyces sp. NBC_01754]
MSTALANERLRKRFARWDVDGNGLLELEDFRQEAARIAQGFGKPEDAPEVQGLRDAFEALYAHLAEQSGSAQAGITEDNFLRATEQLLFSEGEAAFNRALGPVVKSLVDLSDTNGDGVLDSNEFEAWLVAIGLPAGQAGEVLRKVDTNGDGVLSEDELLRVVREYHYGRLDIELLG